MLIVLVAVFLAYNATTGCRSCRPTTSGRSFPAGPNLVKGNEVRVGGFRVGVVDKISRSTTRRAQDDREAST